MEQDKDTSEKEQRILRMYDGSLANEDELFEISKVNHLAWSLLVFALGLVVWLAIALVNAENQRFAMAKGMCQDPVFKGSFDARCMVTVHSRDHWWEHLWYGIRHFSYEAPETPPAAKPQ